VKIAWKWGRWQHQVDYRPFRKNKPKLKPGVVIPDEPNNYGMVLVNRNDKARQQTLSTTGAVGDEKGLAAHE
jgi:hypothetical protein